MSLCLKAMKIQKLMISKATTNKSERIKENTIEINYFFVP